MSTKNELTPFLHQNPLTVNDPLGLYGNVLSAGGSEIYYPVGGWNSANVPGSAWSQLNSSGVENVVWATSVEAAVLGGGAVGAYLGPPVAYLGTAAAYYGIVGGQNLIYGLLAYQMLSQTVGEQIADFWPQFLSGLTPVPPGPVIGSDEFVYYWTGFIIGKYGENFVGPPKGNCSSQ
jgi:hypothetical protein